MKKKQLLPVKKSPIRVSLDHNTCLSSSNAPTQQLFIEISQSNLHSFELLHTVLYHKLLYFCTSFVKFREPAEEIVSDIFVNLWLKRAQLTEIRNPDLYLFVAVRNHSLNYLKKNAGAKVISIGEVEKFHQATPPSPHDEMQKKELMRAMKLAVDSLPEQCRMIFTLVKEYGMKTKEVAEILQLSPRTVETQVFRAVKKLDKVLSPYIYDKSIPGKNPMPHSMISGFLVFFAAIVRSF